MLIKLLKTILPETLHERVLAVSQTDVFTNTLWLFVERIVKMVVGLLIIVSLARYLGPEQFGLFNFSFAFVALFAQLYSLGLEGIVVRDLVASRKKNAETMGTVFIMRLIGGAAAFILACLLIRLLRPDDNLAFLLVAIVAFANWFRAFDVIDYHFQSLVQSKYVVFSKLIAFFTSAFLTILLIVKQANLITFVLVKALELVIASVMLIIFYLRQKSSLKMWIGNHKRARRFLKESWPLILSGISAVIYLKMDQVMLMQLVGENAVGVYAVAAQLSELWYFIPAAVVSSFFPKLIKTKAKDAIAFDKQLQKLFNGLATLAFIIAIPISIFATPVISLLYGESYAEAGAILSIHIWASVFIFMRAAFSKWLIIEGLLIFSLVTHGAGAIVNLILNIVLIPRYAGIGAAVATFLSYGVASYFALFFHSKTYPIARKMTKAIVSPLAMMFGFLTTTLKKS